MKAIGHLVDGDVILCEGCVFDHMTIRREAKRYTDHFQCFRNIIKNKIP